MIRILRAEKRLIQVPLSTCADAVPEWLSAQISFALSPARGHLLHYAPQIAGHLFFTEDFDMKRWAVLGLAVCAFGCQQSGPSAPASGQRRPVANSQVAATDDGVEEFEGMVELFGQTLKARRQVVLTEEGDYVKHGRAVAWYESGQKAGEMFFEHGKPHGEQLVWHENGRKKARGEWDHGLASGKWSEWDADGRLISEGQMVSGQKQGPWYLWDAEASRPQEIEYRNGKPYSVGQAPRNRVR
jgi:hypothetical protein